MLKCMYSHMKAMFRTGIDWIDILYIYAKFIFSGKNLGGFDCSGT
jgi:hypothetical protein